LSEKFIKSLKELEAFLKLSDEEKEAFKRVTPIYPFSSTEYYLRIASKSPSVRRMLLPSLEEVDEEIQRFGEEDPLCEERDKKTSLLTHRYPDRVLIVTTNVCPVLCRFCMRKRNWKKPPFFISDEEIEKAVNYVRENKKVRDVLISGGEPLILPLEKLRKLLLSLKEIEHVEVIRIGTRLPVVLPQKLFDRELLSLLEEAEKVWVNTHFNHPDEITEEAKLAVRNLLKAGIPVNNQTVLLKGVNDQTVLLKGVNDSPEVLEKLLRELQKIKVRPYVRPYYLFHCDPVKGVMHFSTTITKGLEIVEELFERISPLAIPYYAVDGPGGYGKVPLLPHRYRKEGEKYIFRSFDGKFFEMADK